MVFRSKVDAFFVKFILIMVLIIGLAIFLPLFFEDGTGLPIVLIPPLTFLIAISLILLCVFPIKYVFYQDYLFVKGGPFRSQIPYENITKVAPTKAIFTGYKLLSSRDAIEIFYKTGVFGSMKISPKNKKEFISELEKRCHNAQIQV